MALLSDKDAATLRDLFAGMRDPVRLVFFSQEIACQFCRETKMILEEVSALSDKIALEEYNLVTDAEMASTFGVELIPATAIVGKRDNGVRFFGIPSGYEFTSLVEDIMDISSGDVRLEQDTIEFLTTLDQEVDIKVFVTPTCPYCPKAVRMAHRFAIASEYVSAAMVESVEFPQLANKYGVMGVPRMVINEDIAIEGAVPEPLVVARIKQALGMITSEEVDAMFAEAFGTSS